MTTWRWIISHRRCWITVYVFCRNAHMNIIVIILLYICIVMRSIFCQLPICNLFTQHVSYLLRRDTTSELWTPVHSFTLIIQPNCKHCFFSFSAIYYCFPHHTFNPLFSASRWDWQPHCFVGGKVVWLCCVQIPRWRQIPWYCAAPYSATNNLQKWFLSPTGSIKP